MMLRACNCISSASTLQLAKPGLYQTDSIIRTFAKDTSGKGLGESKESDPEIVQKGKEDSQQKDDWQETVASDSEAAVKADRDHHGHGHDIKKMQEHTVEKVKSS